MMKAKGHGEGATPTPEPMISVPRRAASAPVQICLPPRLPMGLKVLVLVCMATHALALGASPRLGPPWARGDKAMVPPRCSDTEVEEPFSRTIQVFVF